MALVETKVALFYTFFIALLFVLTYCSRVHGHGADIYSVHKMIRRSVAMWWENVRTG